MSARRAVIRWGWRLFRREWRQQLLVTALLVLAVTAATIGISAAHSLIPLGQTARLGDANQMFVFDGLEPDAARTQVAAIEERFGTIDVIGRWYVPIPGAADTVEFRAQDPEGAYGARMLALLDGRHPTGAGEVAVTDAVATTFDLDVGSRFTLDGRDWTVVGLVENPADLRDEFALVAPQHADPAQTLHVLVRGPAQPDVSLPEGGFDWEIAGQTLEEQQIVAASAALAAAAVAMVLVSLVATAGFVVIAQRRRRQLGMLAAMGATRKHLRLVTLANGAAVGATAAVVGTVLALAAWIVAAPTLEAAIEARIDELDVLPWWLIASSMLLAVVAATAAAWWPARSVARLPIALALSGQPPRPRPARRSAALAGGLIVAGVVCLLAAGQTNALLTGAGTVATVIGILLVSPLTIRALAAGAVRLPVAVRLALRDLARYHTRSGAALAAITLGLGIAATVIVTTTATERTADSGNLSPDQILVTVEGSRIRELVTVRTAAQVEVLRAHVNRMAAPLDDPAVIGLQMAVDPTEEPNAGDRGNTWRHAILVGDGPQTANPGPLFVATPQLLELYGIDPDAIDPDTDVLTVRTGEVGLRFGIDEQVVANIERLDLPAYTMAPTSLITPAPCAAAGGNRRSSAG
jgi:putative ABC transport system permease protein